MTEVIKKGKDRLFKNYFTTILGVLFMLGAGYVFIVQKDTERAASLGGFGLMFLRSKDSLIGLAAK